MQLVPYFEIVELKQLVPYFEIDELMQLVPYFEIDDVPVCFISACFDSASVCFISLSGVGFLLFVWISFVKSASSYFERFRGASGGF
jgi:hypothetical protein